MDRDEVRSIAEAHLKEHSLQSLYESIVLPALKFAVHDHQGEGLEENARRFMFRSVKELIEDLGEQYGEDRGTLGEETFSYREQPLAKANSACVPASGGADELVTMMLVQLLRQSGFRARQFGPDLPDSTVAEVARGDFGMVCISSISPFAVGEARSLCRRLQAAGLGRQIVMGFWSFQSDAARQRFGSTCPSLVATTLSEALAQIRQLADPTIAAENLSQPDKAQETSV
jgi:methylmalonyl-CoA mutase cobalamin-binding subunit